jgi:hypothetical protein
MSELAAAMLAAGVAFVINRGGIRRFGIAEVVWIGPIMEELGKTGIAVVFGASLVPVHAFFGLLEAMLDLWTGTAHRYAAAFISVVGHSAFGYITMWSYEFFSNWWGGVIAGIVAHVFWNSYVIIFLVKQTRK